MVPTRRECGDKVKLNPPRGQNKTVLSEFRLDFMALAINSAASLDKAPRTRIFNIMVKYKPEPLDSVFSALADPTRRAILARLATGHSSVGELAEPFDISLPAVSRHLRVLRKAGVITRLKVRRVRPCKLVITPLQAASEWIEIYRQFVEGQFDSLAA